MSIIYKKRLEREERGERERPRQTYGVGEGIRTYFTFSGNRYTELAHSLGRVTWSAVRVKFYFPFTSTGAWRIADTHKLIMEYGTLA